MTHQECDRRRRNRRRCPMRAAGAQALHSHAVHGGSPAVQRVSEAKLRPLLRREASPLAQLSAICFCEWQGGKGWGAGWGAAYVRS